MAADLATFVAEFPEFEEMADPTSGAPAVLERALRDAKKMVGRAAWGDRWQDGVFVKAAELLSLTPFGENMRLKDGSSPYTKLYKQMQLALGMRFAITGGVD